MIDGCLLQMTVPSEIFLIRRSKSLRLTFSRRDCLRHSPSLVEAVSANLDVTCSILPIAFLIVAFNNSSLIALIFINGRATAGEDSR